MNNKIQTDLISEMSTGMSTTTTEIEMSVKFKSDIIKFFEWVEIANYVIKKDGVDLEWSLNLNNMFKEPSRNKLIVFIEGLMERYNIYLEDNEIIDAKQLVKNFKDYKPEKKQKKSSPEKKQKKSSVEKISPEKKQRKSSPKKKCDINLDQSLDTSSNGMLCELSQSTDELEKVFGCKAGMTDMTDSRYEWRFSLNDNIYSVYDWSYEDGTFDDYKDNEWFLGGDNDSIEDIKLIRSFLSKKTKCDILNTKSAEFVVDSDCESDCEVPLVL